MILGVTGKYCSGKNAVAEVLARAGLVHIDVDQVGHWALEERAAQVVEAFDSSIWTENGIDRKRLGQLVFSSKKRMRMLEKILHPLMIAEIKRIITEKQGSNILINAALLVPMGLHYLCDAVILVQCPLIVRLFRAYQQRISFRKRLLQIFWMQRNIIPKSFLSETDIYIVRNTKTIQALEDQVLQWWKRYK